MLGIPDPKTELGTEEAILSGRIDSTYIEFVEEELIDDYLFGELSPEEERQFRDHFLCSDDRRKRLAVAQAIKEYASEQPANAFEVRGKSPVWKLSAPRFSWMTLTAVAASCVLAVMLGFQLLHSQKEAEIARNGESEVERLRAALAAQVQRSSLSATSTSPVVHSPESQSDQLPLTGPTPDLLLTPGQTRGLGSQKELHISPAKRIVLIELVLPVLSGEWYREELLTSDERELSAQEFPLHGSHPADRSTMALPAAMLPPGDYQIRLLVASSDRQFQELQSYGFRVKRP